MDVPRSNHRTPEKLAPEDQALLRASLNGTFYTADRLKHHEKNKDDPDCHLCTFYGVPDSQIHRHWECPHFSHCRHLTAEQIATVCQLPPCVAAHGWMPAPPSFDTFRALCMAIPDEQSDFVYPPCLAQVLDCFTDGGCQAPASPLARLASWGG